MDVEKFQQTALKDGQLGQIVMRNKWNVSKLKMLEPCATNLHPYTHRSHALEIMQNIPELAVISTKDIISIELPDLATDDNRAIIHFSSPLFADHVLSQGELLKINGYEVMPIQTIKADLVGDSAWQLKNVSNLEIVKTDIGKGILQL